MKTDSNSASGAPRYLTHQFIVDDGDCKDHGYFLPKQKAAPLNSVGNSGVSVVDVPVSELCDALVGLSANQKNRLASAAITPQ